MRVLLWIGNEENQRALANKIAQKFNVVGIITESRRSKSKMTISIIIKKVIEKIFLSKIGNSWWGMKKYYAKKYNAYPNVPILDIENINSKNAFSFTSDLKPDLIIVSGTRLLKEKMLSIKTKNGILNLHTGLSPYIKGGPNCTNWCISTKQFHLIGNTIMWIDLGIDSGNILTTEYTELDKHDSLLDIHIKVMEHAHDLFLKSINFVSKGKISNVKQSDIDSKGKTYYTKQWNLKAKFNLINNLKLLRRVTKQYLTKKRENIKTIFID